MKRPRKKVLIFCEDEEEMSLVSFVLSTKTYSFSVYYILVKVTTVADAIDAFIKHDFDNFSAAVLVHSQPDDGRSKKLSQYLMQNGVPVLFLDRMKGRMLDTANLLATAYFPGDVPAADWLDRLHILSRRKRGPKKKEPAAVVPETRAA